MINTYNLMVSAGFDNDFFDVYINVGGNVWWESLSRGVEYLTGLVYTNPNIFT